MLRYFELCYGADAVSQVEKVFAAASHKKVWDHFTKAQRKNIDMWKKQSSVSFIKQVMNKLTFTKCKLF